MRGTKKTYTSTKFMLYSLNWKREAGGQGGEREGESGDKEEEEEGNISIKDRKERKRTISVRL